VCLPTDADSRRFRVENLRRVLDVAERCGHCQIPRFHQDPRNLSLTSIARHGRQADVMQPVGDDFRNWLIRAA
jgi:hypothetical protein